MKKYIILMIGFISMYSCVNETNLIGIEDNLNLKRNNLIPQNDDVDDDNILEHSGYNDLQIKLNVYSYAIGRVLIKHPLAAIQIKDAISNNELNLTDLFINNSFVKNKFNIELQLLLDEQFWGRPLGDGTSNGIPPVGLYKNVSYYSEITQEIIYELHSNQYNDCLEMFVARPLQNLRSRTNNNTLESFTIHTTPHPLSNNSWSDGFSLYTDSLGFDWGTETVFDTNFLLSHTENIIVIRPHRNNNCSYDYVDVNDFTTFYNN